MFMLYLTVNERAWHRKKEEVYHHTKLLDCKHAVTVCHLAGPGNTAAVMRVPCIIIYARAQPDAVRPGHARPFAMLRRISSFYENDKQTDPLLQSPVCLLPATPTGDLIQLKSYKIRTSDFPQHRAKLGLACTLMTEEHIICKEHQYHVLQQG